MMVSSQGMNGEYSMVYLQESPVSLEQRGQSKVFNSTRKSL